MIKCYKRLVPTISVNVAGTLVVTSE